MKILKEGFKLFPDQLENAKALVTKRRALFVDSTGSGKTPTILYSFSYLFAKGLVDGLIVFTPKNAHDKEVWKPQIQKFTNFKCISFEEIEKRVLQGAQIQNVLKGIQIVYCKHTSFKNNYSLCVGLLSCFKKPLTVVDEVHAFRSTKSELSLRGSMCLTHSFGLWGITATDLSKNVMDTYNIINFVNPGKLGDERFFIKMFCNTREKVIGRFSDGKLKKVREVVGFKSLGSFHEYVKDTLVIGSRSVSINIHEVPYELSQSEKDMYKKVSSGLCLDSFVDDDSWLRSVLSKEVVKQASIRSMKEVERHSSRYIYLQSVVDGALNPDGTFGLNPGSKSSKLIELISDIVSRGESVLVYFDYYVSLDNVEYQLRMSGLKNNKGRPIKVIETSSRKRQKPGFITAAMCESTSYVVLCSRAASESENYPFINNVILYNVPTTPVTYLQFIGRITRRNTLFPDNLHAWILLGDNIDTYKMVVIGNKLQQMKATSYDLSGVYPEKWLIPLDSARHLELAKKHLLWRL